MVPQPPPAAACGDVDRIGELKPVKDFVGEAEASGWTEVVADRLAGASSLAQAAASGDSRCKPLSDALSNAYKGIAVRFRWDGETIGYLSQARDLCGHL